jgi:hypothetical protein
MEWEGHGREITDSGGTVGCRLAEVRTQVRRLARNRQHSLAPGYKRASASNQPGPGFRRSPLGGNNRGRTNGRASAPYSGEPTPGSRCGEAGGPTHQSSCRPSGSYAGAHRCKIQSPHAVVPVLPTLPAYSLPSAFRKPDRPAKCNRACLTCPAESQAIVSLWCSRIFPTARNAVTSRHLTIRVKNPRERYTN